MTKKLKKKVNRIVIAVLSLTIATLTLLYMNTSLFVMSNSMNEISGISNAPAVLDKTNVTVTTDGIVECDSIVQGVRDCDLPDRKIYI